MPAEWEPHSATWVGWPGNPETWPGCLAEAEAEFEYLVATLATSEHVEILVQSTEHQRYVAARLGDLVATGRTRLHVLPSDDVWLRDIGPTFVESGGEIAAVDWDFNAWGGKYPPWDRDDAVAEQIADLCAVEHLRAGFVCEGGAIDSDGEGTLLATEPTLIDPLRNPRHERVDIERSLSELLGVRRIVWLAEGIEGDDTDGHIDDFARFVAPGRVVCAQEADPGSPNHARLEDCSARLRGTRDAAGRVLEVIDLPMPEPHSCEAGPLPASHANFYIANSCVLVPVFGGDSDERALEILKPLFPGRRILGIPCNTLVRGLGAVHCLTQQQPLGNRLSATTVRTECP
ncbi:MAG: agmatine deiminase family protein [bacterium]|nr:agmatine deiminase family protein [bacterium]